MNPIDTETLRAIGGQKTMEAATSFADTMLRLHQIRKQGELVDLQLKTGEYDLSQKQEEAPARKEILKSEVNQAKASGMEAQEFMSPESSAARAKQTALSRKDTDVKLKLIDEELNSWDESAKVRLMEKANIAADTKTKYLQTVAASIPIGNEFKGWKANNADLVEQLKGEPEFAKIMNQNVLTQSQAVQLQNKILERSADWVRWAKEAAITQGYDMEKLNAKAAADADKAASKVKPVVTEYTPDYLVKNLLSEFSGEVATSTAAGILDIQSAVKRKDIGEVDMGPILQVAKQIATDAERGANDPNYVNQQFTILKNDLQQGNYSKYFARAYGYTDSEFNTYFAKARALDPTRTDGEILQMLQLTARDARNPDVKKQRAARGSN